jgi:hypothetical protein
MTIRRRLLSSFSFSVIAILAVAAVPGFAQTVNDEPRQQSPSPTSALFNEPAVAFNVEKASSVTRPRVDAPRTERQKNLVIAPFYTTSTPLLDAVKGADQLTVEGKELFDRQMKEQASRWIFLGAEDSSEGDRRAAQSGKHVVFVNRGPQSILR